MDANKHLRFKSPPRSRRANSARVYLRSTRSKRLSSVLMLAAALLLGLTVTWDVVDGETMRLAKHPYVPTPNLTSTNLVKALQEKTDRVETGVLKQGDELSGDGSFVDVYEFRAVKGEEVTIDLESEAFDTYLVVTSDLDEDLLLNNDDYMESTNHSQIVMTAEFEGVYQVHVTTYEPGETGAYRMTIRRSGEAVVPVQASWVDGTLVATDPELENGEHYHVFPLVAGEGETFQIDLRSQEFDPYLLVGLPSSTDFEVLENDDFEESEEHSQITLVAPEAGEYQVMVTSYEADEFGDYRLTIIRQPERIEYGELQRGDDESDGKYVDHVSFEAIAGQSYTIDLTSDLFDPMLVILDPEDDSFLLSNDDHAESTMRSRIEMVAPRSGQFDIYVTSYEEAEVGDYMLTVDRGPGRFRRAGGFLDDDDEVLENGEYFDVYEFDGEPGQRVRVRLESTEFDTYVILVAPSEEVLENDDFEEQTTLSLIDTTLMESGNYQIIVTSYEADEVGAYDLTLYKDSPGLNGSGGGITQLDGQGVLDLQLDSNDFVDEGHYFDAFAFEGSVGDRVRIEMSSDSLDSVLVLLTPNDHEYVFDDSDESTDALLEMELPEDGTYRMFATSYEVDATGDYNLDFDMDAETPSGIASIFGNANADSGQRILGVFVGISDYPGRGSDLAYCDNDAELVYEVLANEYGMSNSDSVLLTNEDATRDNIVEAIRSIGARADENDMLIFFFSGHGGQHRADSIGDNRLDPNGVHETMVSYDDPILDSEFAQLINDSDAGTCLVVIDACFSGGFGKNVVSAPGRMGLFSSQEDVLSMVADKFRAGGYLSRFFVDAISTDRDAADEIVFADGAISAFELQHYIAQRYEEDVRTTKSGSAPAPDDFVSPADDLSFQRLHADWGGLVGPHQLLFKW